MCGIAGILGVTDPEAAEREVRAMIERIAHRGPDGIRVESGPGWCVAHARLSIIDLEGGWQPLHAAGSTIIGNGEIYNYVELAEEFGLKDRLSTGSDFEPLLHIYALEGEKAFERLRGMYAFCLIGGDGRTWLVRDRFGIKPLYYREYGETVSFASEPRAFNESEDWKAQPNDQLLALNYLVDLDQTPVGIGALRLGTGRVMEFKDSELKSAGYLLDPLTPGPTRLAHSEEALIGQLDAVLEDSVRVHQRSDVPYGLFLSGGIDSAAIATLMSRLNERPVTAYTCGFDVPGARDERSQAERVAKALSLDWREIEFGEEDFWRIAPQVAWALDDPTADYATLPTFRLAEAAKGALTVVLTGEGGDELFAGYGRYRRALRPAWLGGRPAGPQVDAPFLKTSTWGPPVSFSGPEGMLTYREFVAVVGQNEDYRRYSKLQQAQWMDIQTWLPNDLLLKLDRCLMVHGLEGRTPFLDKSVAAFAFNLPDRMKVRGKYGKYILRKWLERHCPAAEPWAKKKGFTVPVAAWIAPRAEDLAITIPEVEAVAEVCDEDAVRAVFTDDRQAHNRWPLLFFALWALIHLEGAEPQAALASLLGEA